MSSLSETFVRLAGRLGTGNVSDAEFYAAFSTSSASVQELSLKVLQKALETHDPVLVELGLYIGHRFGFKEEHLGALNRLACEEWHTQHENVVEGLARLRSTSSIEPLYMTALSRHKYLEYDEAFALAVKCIWALGDIEDDAAVARLSALSRCGNDVLERNATDQLLRIQGKNNTLREAATKALESIKEGS